MWLTTYKMRTDSKHKVPNMMEGGVAVESGNWNVVVEWSVTRPAYRVTEGCNRGRQLSPPAPPLEPASAPWLFGDLPSSINKLDDVPFRHSQGLENLIEMDGFVSRVFLESLPDIVRHGEPVMCYVMLLTFASAADRGAGGRGKRGQGW